MLFELIAGRLDTFSSVPCILPQPSSPWRPHVPENHYPVAARYHREHTGLSRSQHHTTDTVSPGTAGITAAHVVLDGKPLFSLQEKILSLTPEDRASLISARLARLARNPLFKADTISTVEGETTTDITTGEIIIMTVTEKDAEVTGKPRTELARNYEEIFRAAITESNNAYSIRSISIGALYALLATAVLVALLIAIARLFKKVVAKINSCKGTKIRTIRFQSLELLQEDRNEAFLITVANTLRNMLILILPKDAPR